MKEDGMSGALTTEIRHAYRTLVVKAEGQTPRLAEVHIYGRIIIKWIMRYTRLWSGFI
jgi:hypothetical protein